MTRKTLKDNIKHFVFESPDHSQAPADTLALQVIHPTFTFCPAGKPPRYHYDLEQIHQWAEIELKPNGIHNPLWVRPHPDKPGEYELVAGFRRYKGAEHLGLGAVPVRIFDWDDTQAFAECLAENLHRSDFSPLEETDAILQLLAASAEMTISEAIAALGQLWYAKHKHGDNNVIISPFYSVVQSVFAFYGRMEWESFVVNRLPLLKLPDSLLNPVRRGELTYTSALALSKVKDPEQRDRLTESAIADSLSLAQIKSRIAQEKPQKPDPQSDSGSQGRWRSLNKVLSNKKYWVTLEPSKARQLNSLLEQIQELVGDSEQKSID